MIKTVDLTKIWYEIVSLDHHKDRDCHWTIEIQYSYGNKPVYAVLHYGYVYKEIKKKFYNLRKANRFLRQEIKKAIRAEYVWAKKVLAETDRWDECDMGRAQYIIKLWKI